MATRLGSRLQELTQEQLNEAPVSYGIDLSSGKVALVPHNYPNDYLKDGIKGLYFSVASRKQEVIYSFQGDHHLYVGTPDNSSLEANYAPSRYLPQHLPSQARDATPEQFNHYFLTAPKYGNIYYDKFRDVFYRLVFPEYEVKDEESLRELSMYVPFFSVQILGPDLALLGETLMDKEPLNPFNAFVGKKGLYISNSNINHPDFNEDQMGFYLFELKEGQGTEN